MPISIDDSTVLRMAETLLESVQAADLAVRHMGEEELAGTAVVARMLSMTLARVPRRTTDDIAAALFRCVVSVYVSDAATRASAGAVTTAAARVAAAFEQTTSTSADGKHRLDVREVSVEVASDPATNHATRTVAVNVTGVAVRDSGNSFEDLIT